MTREEQIPRCQLFIMSLPKKREESGRKVCILSNGECTGSRLNRKYRLQSPEASLPLIIGGQSAHELAGSEVRPENTGEV
jgi:hypothetical protein